MNPHVEPYLLDPWIATISRSKVEQIADPVLRAWVRIQRAQVLVERLPGASARAELREHLHQLEEVILASDVLWRHCLDEMPVEDA